MLHRHLTVFALALGLVACAPLSLSTTTLPTLAPTHTPSTDTPMPSATLANLLPPTSVAQAALAYLMKQTQLPLDSFVVTQVEAVDWSDSCLGIAAPGEACLMVITPGYRVVVQDKVMQYELHTNTAGTVVRMGEPEALPATKLLSWQRTGGIAGVCYQMLVASTGYYTLADCGEPHTLFGAGQLPAKEWAQLQEKAASTASFTWDTPIPPGSADMFADHLEFVGVGKALTEPPQAEAFSNELSQWWATLQRTAPDFTRSGVTGLAQISPTCPGPTRDDAACAPAPYPALFQVVATTDLAAPLATVQLDASGTFRIALPPGEYVLVPMLSQRFPTAGEVSFKVAKGEFTAVVLEYDSGMR